MTKVPFFTRKLDKRKAKTKELSNQKGPNVVISDITKSFS